MASKASQLDHLKSVPLFAGLNKKQLQLIAKSSDEVSLAAGDVLVDQGQTGREAFLLLAGQVTVKRNGRKVATLGPGDCVGELALLDHGPRTATVVADGDMTLFVLGARQFAGVIDEVPALSRKVMAYLATRIRELDSKIFT